MSSILQIVPRLPPPEEALGQVALRLGEAFSAAGVDSRIVPAMADRGNFLDQLAAAPDDQAVLLHYVGYGYAPRGAPVWLARSLTSWLAAAPVRRLAVHFHEVAAFGPPWRSSFWISPLQRRTAARLRRLAVAAVTSVDRFERTLAKLAPGHPTELMPIFSTIGEPHDPPRESKRQPQLLLFGGPAARARIWSEATSELGRAARALDVAKILEVGREPEGPERLVHVPVERTGELAAAEVARLLGASSAAFFDYPVEYLSKSSAFAAACAYEVLPVCRPRRQEAGPAPGEGERWVTVDGLEGLPKGGRGPIAAAARRWYEGHSIARHAAFWREALAR